MLYFFRYKFLNKLVLFHCLHELRVVLGAGEHVQNVLHGLLGLQSVQALADNVHGLQLLIGQQQILAAGTGLGNVDGRKYALLLELPVQYQLHVAGSLEFLVNDVVHLASSFYQCRCKNGQALWPLRTAVSGKQMTPAGAFEIMEVIGKEESISRIKKGIELLSK